MEGWNVRNEHELKCLVEYCERHIAEGKPLRFEVLRKTKRTNLQNRALHKGFGMLAEELNEAGFDMQRFPFKEGMDIPWDGENVKNHLFRPVMVAMVGKTSTAKLTKDELSRVWDVLIRHIAQKTGVAVEFPSWESFYAGQTHQKGR